MKINESPVPATGSTTIKRKYKSKKVVEAERKEKLEMDSAFCRMQTRYDPEAIRAEAMATPLALARRSAKVASKFWRGDAARRGHGGGTRRDAAGDAVRSHTRPPTTFVSIQPRFNSTVLLYLTTSHHHHHHHHHHHRMNCIHHAQRSYACRLSWGVLVTLSARRMKSRT